MAIPPPLTADEVRSRLTDLEGWEGDTTGITRTVGIEYHAGIRLVVDVAKAAKEQMHHPDIDIRWDTMRFFITTHDACHVVTELDFRLAETINELTSAHGATSLSPWPRRGLLPSSELATIPVDGLAPSGPVEPGA